jgi:glucokinase
MESGGHNGQLRGGIDLGGTKIEAIVVDDDQNVVGQDRQPTPIDGGPADVADQMAEALTGAAKAAGVETSSLQGVGVGSPGDVNEETGTVANARNLPNWMQSFELGKTLSDKLGTKVYVGNDVQVAPRRSSTSGPASPISRCSGSSGAPGSGVG